MKAPDDDRMELSGDISEALHEFLTISINSNEEVRDDVVSPLMMGLMNVFIDGFEGSILYEGDEGYGEEDPDYGCDCPNCSAMRLAFPPTDLLEAE